MAEVKHLRPLHGYQSWGWKTEKNLCLEGEKREVQIVMDFIGFSPQGLGVWWNLLKFTQIHSTDTVDIRYHLYTICMIFCRLCEVKNASTLQKALDAFTQSSMDKSRKKKTSILTLLACHWGEQLRGANKYQCKKCQQKVDATKTCCPELERFLTFDVVSYVSLEGSRSSFSATSKVFNPLCTTAAELPAEALRLSTRSSWCLDCKNEPFKMWLGYDKFGWQAALPFALQFQESRHVDARLTLK